jgi:carbonic anhydrase
MGRFSAYEYRKQPGFDMNTFEGARTLFTATNAGGRAAFALESVAAMDYIFSVKNVVVVHHSFCGTTTRTPELVVEEFHDHYHADISKLFDHDSLAIMDFEESLNYDIKLLRDSPAVPKHVELYGFFYEISSGKLTEVVRDIAAPQSATVDTEKLTA